MSSNHSFVETRSPHRLPTDVVPSFYDMRITPDLPNATFAGQSRIEIDVSKPVKQIVLNAADLNITEVALSDANGTRLIGRASHDEESERATLTFDGTVGIGHWDLHLTFTGTLNDKLKGFYRSSYKNARGESEFIATTKFEPSDARRAFPCWDEPAFKARFKISLVIDEKLNAVSNARLLNETKLAGGKKLLEYAPTIKMSTYLVAYIVGNLEASEPVNADGTEIRVWSVPGKRHLHGFALSAAKYTLEYFARYFNKPYPGDKLDLVAIPDFASGAMENFGCITFRETALLVDTTTASHAELERVAEVVAHENAHMWFGDLVTMTWWNGLWLNEAFATFMAAKAVDDWKPEWKVWENFNVDRAVALRVDGLNSTRPIEFTVHTPEEARGMFDVLTYQKGCAVLRMLELFVGEDKFRAGIAEFLNRHQYNNADTPDLWSAIEFATGPLSDRVSVTDLMNSWVFQSGYPVITVSESTVSGSIKLTQSVFKYVNGKQSGSKWHVPVTIRAIADGDTLQKTVLLSEESESFYLGENVSFVVVNAGGNGFFRVRYSDDLSVKLLSNLALLTASERFNLLGDLWASVLAGGNTLSQFLDTAGKLTGDFGERDHNVCSIIVSSLHYLRRLVPADAASQQGFVKLARRYLGGLLMQLGWDKGAEELPQTGQLRASVVSALGSFGDAEVLDRSQQLFASFKADRQAVDTNLVPALVEALAGAGDKGRYDEFLSMRATAPTPQEETRFMYALASFRDEKLLADTLARCINGDIRTQDAPFLVRGVMMNPAGARQAWEFTKANWDTIVKLYPMQGVTRLCEGVTGLVDPELEADVRQFFTTHPVKGGDKAVAQYLELLGIAVAFSGREKSWLLSQLS